MFTKVVVGALIISFLSVPLAERASADTNGWEAAGLVLAGAVGYAILNDIATSDSRPRHYVGVPVYRRPRTVRTYHVSYRPRRYWVAGHYESVTRKVWVDGFYEKVWVPPITRRVWVRGRRGRRGRGHWEQEIVECGHYRKVWREGYYDYRTVDVRVEGSWDYR